MFLCQLVSLLQEQITIDLINKVNHSIVSLLQRHEQDKLCYMHVVKTNQQWVCFKNAFDINLVIKSVTQ